MFFIFLRRYCRKIYTVAYLQTLNEEVLHDDFVDFSGAVSATIRMVSNESHSSKVTLLKFDAANDDLRESLSGIDRVDYVINCIGVIKPHIKDSDDKQRANAIAINGLFPYSLESWSREVGAKVLQIATDCVFSGATGGSNSPFASLRWRGGPPVCGPHMGWVSRSWPPTGG
jgi:hypothetical protein